MPEIWVREKAAKLKSMPALASIFQVSQAAMRIRLEELGLSQGFPHR